MIVGMFGYMLCFVWVFDYNVLELIILNQGFEYKWDQ